MIVEHLFYGADSRPIPLFAEPEHRTVAGYERELAGRRVTESRLRDALARSEALLRQKDELIRQKEALSKESDHRLLNGLQMIVSLLSLQSRSSANAETASLLAVAADRVATIARVHRRLHSLDRMQTVAFKQYLENFCLEFSAMLPAEERPAQVIVVEGTEIELPTVTAVPLGFIANELITNAAKYGEGRITVRLEPSLVRTWALSVHNDGPALPDVIDLTASKGLGMKIIRCFVERIGGDLRMGRGDGGQGARFTVLF